MTQEEKNLLMKDISARIPYKVFALIFNEYEDYRSEIEGIDIDGYVIDFEGSGVEVECIRPYLFPLSSMTEEQLYESQEILGKDEIKIEDGCLHIVDSDRNIITYLEILALLEWFYKNHFDINGLIKKGLAIDATGLNIY